MSPSLLGYHREMLQDEVRMSAWRQAIRLLVKPGHVVVDLGAGTGILSFLACAAGASRVYAIEEAPVLAIAQEAARQSGFADRITFLAESSDDISLPERADVVLGDVFGAFGLNGNILATMIDARHRFLKPGGVLLPRGAEMFSVPVEMPEFYQKTIDGWSADLNGFDYRACRRRLVNAMHLCSIPVEAALAAPASLGGCDLLEAVTPSWQGRASFQIKRDGVLHGMAGWCTARLTADISVSNSPFASRRLDWSQALFPLDSPVLVRAGDKVEAHFQMATHGAWMVWNWHVTVTTQAAGVEQFSHSTFQGEWVSLDELRRLGPSFIPTMSARGELVQAALELCDGSHTFSQISEAMAQRFPRHFPDPLKASRFVSKVIHSWCR